VHTRISGVATTLPSTRAPIEIAADIVSTSRRQTFRGRSATSRSPPTTPGDRRRRGPALRKGYDSARVMAHRGREPLQDSRPSTARPCHGIRTHPGSPSASSQQRVLFSESALKATHFIEMCALRRIRSLPAEHTGFIVARSTSTRASPKTGQDGAAWPPPRSRSSPSSSGAARREIRDERPGLQPRQLWMWPNARISVMGGGRRRRCGPGQARSSSNGRAAS